MKIGLYYLQSRYYDPEVGRFINLDETSIAAATTGEILGTNLFAYCFNNPINYIDYNGYETEYGINFDPRRPNLWGNDDYKYDKNAIAGKKINQIGTYIQHL